MKENLDGNTLLKDDRKLLDSEFGMPAAKAVFAIVLAFLTAIGITMGSEYVKHNKAAEQNHSSNSQKK